LDDSDSETEVEELVKELGLLNAGEFAERRLVVYQERFQIPLFFAVIFFFLSSGFLLGRCFAA